MSSGCDEYKDNICPNCKCELNYEWIDFVSYYDCSNCGFENQIGDYEEDEINEN
jgi:Zn ribbon nucleic-acid-binding protein